MLVPLSLFLAFFRGDFLVVVESFAADYWALSWTVVTYHFTLLTPCLYRWQRHFVYDLLETCCVLKRIAGGYW